MHKYITDRLEINPLELSHDSFILELLNTAGWKQFIGDRNITSVQDAQIYIHKILNNELAYYWVVSHKEDAQSIGVISFLKRDYLEHWDLGFAFLPQYSGQGMAAEAAGCVLKNLQKTHSIILATVMPSNFNSIKLLEKLGFLFKNSLERDDLQLLLYSYH